MHNGLNGVAPQDGAQQDFITDVADDQPGGGGTAHLKPVERLWRTTTRSPASSSASTMWLPM